MSEAEIVEWFRERAEESGSGYTMFLGAGAYHHYRPVVIDSLISRGEFFTAYTPYQPEISQGTLQAIFEFQTMICELTGMEVANASMYDGSTGCGRGGDDGHAPYRAPRRTGGPQRAPRVSRGASAPTRNTRDCRSRRSASARTAASIWPPCARRITPETACLLIQSPNFFGTIEDDRPQLAEAVHANGALLVVAIAEAGVAGHRQAAGRGRYRRHGGAVASACRSSYGGPYAGVIATKESFVRQMPGRLVGETRDQQRQARLRAHALHPRAAHPPREGDLEHLHQPGADRADGQHLHDRCTAARD